VCLLYGAVDCVISRAFVMIQIWMPFLCSVFCVSCFPVVCDLTDLANTVHSLFCILFLPTSSEQSVDSHAAIVVRGLLRHILQLVSSWASYCSHSLLHWHLSKVTCSLLFLWVCDERLVFFRCIALTFCLQCFDAVGWAAGRASGL